MAIALRKPQEIEKLRAANKIVGGALDDVPPPGRLPLVDAAVGPDVSDALGVHLKRQSISVNNSIHRPAAQANKRLNEPESGHHRPAAPM